MKPPYTCPRCGLADVDNGQGDGVTTCPCDRCPYGCGAGPGNCACSWLETKPADPEDE